MTKEGIRVTWAMDNEMFKPQTPVAIERTNGDDSVTRLVLAASEVEGLIRDLRRLVGE